MGNVDEIESAFEVFEIANNTDLFSEDKQIEIKQCQYIVAHIVADDNDELLNFIMKYKEISNTSNGDEIYFDSFMKYICKNEIREILKNKLLSIQKNEEIIKNNNYVDTYKYGLSGEHKETHLVEYLLDFYFKEVNIK